MQATLDWKFDRLVMMININGTNVVKISSLFDVILERLGNEI